ncbi:Glycerophosphoryl diester phosphodiesterase [hydrothermal vent metagenome]|uniref:glycerophosphodiester phosphodiesterase n=1 Tax=hydrothermal vent metagenome TaxID=652676 RepID=A0A3B0RHN5_9ZZZZ
MNRHQKLNRRQVLRNVASVTALAPLGVAGLQRGVAFAASPIANLENRMQKPIIIAHRGACGYLPEHTIEGYQLAIDLGADFIEPDMVFTKDGHLIARHDHYLSTTTNVAEHAEFASRKTTRPDHDGEDWFSEDFTLAEIKTLRAKQAMPERSHEADGKFEIPTIEEVFALTRANGVSSKRDVALGVYPETKLPGYFNSIGHDYQPALIAELEKVGWWQNPFPLFVQSFEPEILMAFKQSKPDLPLIMLIEKKQHLRLAEIAKFADGIGPFKGLLVDKSGASTGVIEQAHKLGLDVHPWTFRSDQLPKEFSNPQAEFDFFFDLGVDGVFTDFCNDGKAAKLARIARTTKG